jgi:serine protease Do
MRLKPILIMIALGVVVATAIFQVNRQGIFPKNLSNLPSLETRTVVQEENAIISVVDRVSPSVVAIGITQRVVNPFDPFALPTNQSSTIGTGFVVSEKGIIVTNKHVVSDSNAKYTVLTKDEQKYEVRRIYRDPVFDLAVVQIDANGLTPVEIGDSSKLKVGQTAIAIGNALGRFTNTVTTGIISGLGRKVIAGDAFGGSQEALDDLIQTDAAINPGNSGGPLLNSAGQVIGVNVAVTEGAQNIGFAIPINSVKSIVDEFVTKGSVSRPYLGVRYRFISREVAIINEVPQGAYVQEVVVSSPAAKAGVKAGDIVTKINGQNIDSEQKISEVIAKSGIGNKVELTLFREEKEVKVTATLEELPSE